MSAAQQGGKPPVAPSPVKLGTITDSQGNVFAIVPASDVFGSRPAKSVVPIDKYKAQSKPTAADPVYKDGVATFESSNPFSLLFMTAPDQRDAGRVYFQATRSPDPQPVWRADVAFFGHKAGVRLDYEIYDPGSGAKIDPSVIIIDPVAAKQYVLERQT